MQITMNNTLYPGLSAMQVGQSRVDQAATQIASSNIEARAIRPRPMHKPSRRTSCGASEA
ncbi:hypothetical protein B1F67_24345 [Pseudomonas syringae]|nr:hypothetical protein B1F67_24345 [Pseudomonas syringae]